MTFKFNPIDWQALLAVLEMLIFLKILFEIRSDVKSRREHREALSLNFYTYFWNRFDKIVEVNFRFIPTPGKPVMECKNQLRLSTNL